ncbi:MAG: hypothetical protein FJ109_05290 [Deltaproteobacteria bacterium]|nr:hypothetical protein [Deltaproteobacteria bacterium]
MKARDRALVLLAGMVVALGCGDLQSSKSVFHTETVGPKGKTVVFETLKIEIPAGALDKEVDVSVGLTQDHPSGNIGPVYEVEIAATLLKPVTLGFTVDKSLVGEEVSFEELAPAWVGDDGKWTVLEEAVATAGSGATGTVAGTTTHLSTWGVLPNPVFPPPPCEEGCDDDDPCTVDSCDKVGNCSNEPKDCDDANPCTTDICDKEGNCSNAPVDCDDGDVCTEDKCVGDAGCVHTPIPDCCSNVGYFSDWKVPGDTCWDPPKNYCSEGASTMVTVACTQDLSLCCVYADSCVPCGWTTDCEFCPVEGGDEWEYHYCGPPGGACAAAPVPLPAFSSPECPPPHSNQDEPICLDEEPPVKKQMGESCQSDDECETGQCVDVGAPGKICTADCLEECPPPFVCQGIEVAGGDLVFVCMPPCTPDCAGKECGDDGCGGTCGTCDAGCECSMLTGQCMGSCGTCTPDCTDKECGDDGCGGSCGVCEAGCTCSSEGKCVGICETCHPNCKGKACGPDGCGGKCGECGTGVCGADGQCHLSCEPACEPQGKCGPDGCGTWCGNCPENQGVACSDQGACEPCTPSCEGKACGPDGCRGWCDLCPVGQTCSHETGQCLPACTCQGSPCFADGFESGDLDGWSVDGDAQVVSNLGATPAPEGSYMALVGNGISAQHEGGSIERGFCVPADAKWLKMTFAFYSEEFNEWCGSIYQDAVEVTLSDGQQTVTVLDFSIDDVCPASECNGCGTLFGELAQSDVAFDQGDVWSTAWQKLAFPLPPEFAGKPVTLKVSVTDKGDSIYISVFALDAIEFSTAK